MARSLTSAAVSGGLAAEAVAVVERAYLIAMGPRVRHLADDHHPAYLHPGRTALVLLADVEETDPAVLAVAMLHESQDLDLAADPEEVSTALAPSAMEAIATIPLPGDERLVERLLALGPGIARAALAERLDHLRHLHLREDLVDSWADTHVEVASAWLPFAARVHPELTRRYAHWARTFAKRI